ncbi:hypothetical protein Pcinc_043790 [Petrolisthes cinctipes]|uniref:Uncharacterized protein n=1 Tax=Petrolisthes cinctipes TaxID=88211 RepID=A0AAE1BH20_PETCI|nr:hypothetical protein Pcinc_043790 [Petrolisthes cinctipes]
MRELRENGKTDSEKREIKYQSVGKKKGKVSVAWGRNPPPLFVKPNAPTLSTDSDVAGSEEERRGMRECGKGWEGRGSRGEEGVGEKRE